VRACENSRWATAPTIDDGGRKMGSVAQRATDAFFADRSVRATERKRNRHLTVAPTTEEGAGNAGIPATGRRGAEPTARRSAATARGMQARVVTRTQKGTRAG